MNLLYLFLGLAVCSAGFVFGKPLDCSKASTVLIDAGRQQAAQAFDALVAALPTRRHQKGQLVKWHISAVESAKPLLRMANVEFDEVPYVYGMTQLKIRPVENGSALNQLAFEMFRKFGGLELIYSPSRLVGEGLAEAKYVSGEKKAILLPHAAIRDNVLTPSVHHEVLHAVFEKFLDEGQDSLFHGTLESANRISPMWASSHYGMRMSLQELATTALSIRLMGRDCSLGNLRRLEKKIEIAHTLSSETSRFTHELKPLLDEAHSEAVPLTFSTQTKGKPPGPVVEIVWVEVTHGNIRFRVPLLGKEAAAAARANDLPGLRKKLANRIADLDTLSSTLSSQYTELFGVLRPILARAEAGKAEPGDAAALEAAARIPRDTTLGSIQIGNPPARTP